MTYFPQPHRKRRSARVEFPFMIRAALRFEDGRHCPGKLRTISLTGGLLRLSKPQVPGTLVEVMFLTAKGPVVGVAELLGPVSATLKCMQAFKFIMMEDDDHRRLRGLIGAGQTQAQQHGDGIGLHCEA